MRFIPWLLGVSAEWVGCWASATEESYGSVKAEPTGDKPVSVRATLPWRVVVIPLGPPLLTGSSSLPGSSSETGRLVLPYLALLHAGFSMPDELLRPRCALTAPFHPYPSAEALGRYLFCCTFRSMRLEAQPPAVNRRVALRRPDFPPSGTRPPSDYLPASPALTVAQFFGGAGGARM